MQHTFFVHFSLFRFFFARLQRETSRNFQVTRLMKEMLYVFLFTLFLFFCFVLFCFLFYFFHCRSISPWWPLAILIFWSPPQIFHLVLRTKNVSLFYIFRSSSLSLFFSLSSAGLSSAFSFSLSLFFSIFQICGRDN